MDHHLLEKSGKCSKLCQNLCIYISHVLQNIFMLKHHIDKQCQSDNQCTIDKSCIRGQCKDPCSLRGACGSKALCEVLNHRPRCTCPECHTGSPFVRCKLNRNCKSKTEPDTEPVQCESNAQCSSDTYCEGLKGMCISPCGATSVCATNEKCVANLHKASCQCKHKLVINAAGELTCPGGANICSSDSACPQHLSCINQVCQSPCHTQSCPTGKSCHVLNHKAICMCSSECESEASICLKDRGCPRDMACVGFTCKNPCDGITCKDNTPCVVENHKAVCKFCPPGFVADQNYGCMDQDLG